MIRRPTTRRTGTSLLEVLVGLGILAIGALIPRVSLSTFTTRRAIAQNSRAVRYCRQLDGLLFGEGDAVATQNSIDMRELRYNWLWVLQRPVNSNRHTVRMQVVVFNRRAD